MRQILITAVVSQMDSHEIIAIFAANESPPPVGDTTVRNKSAIKILFKTMKIPLELHNHAAPAAFGSGRMSSPAAQTTTPKFSPGTNANSLSPAPPAALA